MDILQFLAVNPTVFLIIVALFSLVVGSFLNVVIHRLPRMLEERFGEECRLYLGLKNEPAKEQYNLMLPHSHCPECKALIRPWHNIPILSYIFLRGRCKDCHTKISARYPFVEALTAIVSVYVAWRFGVSWQTLAALIFTWICICLTFIDLDYHLLPDHLTLLLLWLGLFFSIFNFFCTPQEAILGAISGYLIFAVTQSIFEWTTGKIGMGQGDYKFLAAFGGFLGWQLLPLIILLASITGVLFAFVHMLIKRNFKSVPIPFGPYLALAGWIAMLWGKEIMRFYLL